MEKDLRLFVTDEKSRRIDTYVSEKAKISRTLSQKLIDDGMVTVNDEIPKQSSKVNEGDIVHVRIPMPKDSDIKEEEIPLDILFEDEHIVVINKKRGMVVHPAPGHQEGTLVNALMYHIDDLSGVGGVERPGIVHRLDKNTSGVMVIAKSDKAHQRLTSMFQLRNIEKEYLAIVFGKMRGHEGIINLPIGRDPNDRKKMAVVTSGKNAVTRWKVRKSYGDFSLVSMFLETGRTHQIRVHLKQVGNPVVCDPEYSSGRVCPFAIDGQALHSHRLAFEHPITGEKLSFEVPLPDDMKRIIQELEGEKVF